MGREEVKEEARFLVKDASAPSFLKSVSATGPVVKELKDFNG